MPSDHGYQGQPEQYLVASRQPADAGGTQDLIGFLQLLRTTPGAVVLDDGGQQPKRLVVQMTAALAETLKARFGDRLIIEPNAPLRYPSAGP